MKLLLLAICFAALLMEPVLSWGECPANQTHVECKPCDSFCCEEPRICSLICIVGDFCACDAGFVRPTHGSDRCILPCDCHCHVNPHCGC